MVIGKFEDTLGTDEEMVTKKLERWAMEIGNKTFIYYGEDKTALSYKEFDDLTNRFANNLRDMGIEKGDRISLFLKNSLITTISMFGIWKAGAVFSPINFNYKGRLLSYQINDTEPKILITEEQMIPLINDVKAELAQIPVILHKPKRGDHDYKIEIEKTELDYYFPLHLFSTMLEGSEKQPDIELNYYDTANIIYTSGTTGPAKGVVQSYRWIHGYTYMFRAFNKQEDVIYNDLPMYHVGGAFALVARAAFLGCTVSMWDKFSPNEFWERIEISGASNAILLDVMIPWLMNAEPKENDHKNTLNRVHMQPLPKYHKQVAERFGINFISGGYGQTEAGNGFVGIIDELEKGGTPSDLYKGYSRRETEKIAASIGVPFEKGYRNLPKGYMGGVAPFYETTILNEYDEECQIGEAGQLVFRPRFPQLILKEYYKAPEATVNAFTNLWFHTGDVGYKDKNNVYYFVDRMKDVIRHKGENISSFQVEDMINQHEHVNVCAAFPVPAVESDEDDIAVYIVLKKEISMKDLNEWIQLTMPKYMWPKYVRFISDLPRTPTNKIEKYKLRSMFLMELEGNKI